jgi:hypothetical protein
MLKKIKHAFITLGIASGMTAGAFLPSTGWLARGISD